MSALALILSNQGYVVQGSDLSKNEFTEKLQEHNIKVFIGHKKSNIDNAIDVVVYSSAISEQNEELKAAKEKNLKIFSRAQILQEISKAYDNVISIAGAHGKTTTAGMITEVFMLAGLKPTAHIGGVVKSFNSNYLLGDHKYFITEACEYKNNFLLLNSTVGVILNVEPEHLDFFKTYENVLDAFKKFAQNSKTIIMYQKVPINHENAVFYGQNGYNARKVKKIKHGRYQFVCYFDNKKLFKVVLNVVGKHNIYNALATIAVCKYYGIRHNIIKQAIKNFSGISRRYDIKKIKPFIVHDYAHHPSQIKSVIEATRNFKKKLIIVAFQPHTYTRTQTLMNEFVDAFDVADDVCIVKTYSAREPFLKGGSAKTLYQHLKKKLKNIEYFSNFQSCYEYLQKKIKKTDTLLILGAGDIEILADKFKSDWYFLKIIDISKMMW